MLDCDCIDFMHDCLALFLPRIFVCRMSQARLRWGKLPHFFFLQLLYLFFIIPPDRISKCSSIIYGSRESNCCSRGLQNKNENKKRNEFDQEEAGKSSLLSIHSNRNIHVMYEIRFSPFDHEKCVAIYANASGGFEGGEQSAFPFHAFEVGRVIEQKFNLCC